MDQTESKTLLAGRPAGAPKSPMLQSDSNLERVQEVEGYKVLPPCVLYGKIGQGGMGAVYRGRHLNLDIDVAVKCLKPDLTGEDEQFVVRFKREARSAARINHQNVVRVFDVSEDGGLHYIVMELVQGETARQRVQRKGSLKVGEALEILHGAAQGLGEAHSKGFIHRDIKPDNLMICQSGAVKVADLGLAKPSGSGQMSMLSGTNVVMGTPQYMPPEQWENTATVTPAADVWALGATLYYLLVGGEAIAKDSLPRIMQRIVLQPFPDVREQRPDVPDDVAGLIERATAKDPADRFADAREMADAIQRLETRRESLRDLGAVEEGEEHQTLLSPPPAKTLAKIKFWLDEQAQGVAGEDEGQTMVSPASRRGGGGKPQPQPRKGGSGGRPAGSLLVGSLVVAAAAVALWLWQPWRDAATDGSPFAVADAMLRERRFADAERETQRVFAGRPLLPGKDQRLAALHLAWARQLLSDGDFRGALAQVDKSESLANSDDAGSLRRAALAKAAMAIDAQLVRRAPGEVPVAAGAPVRFRGRLASAMVTALSIDGEAVELGDDGTFAGTRNLQGRATVPVRATLAGGYVVTLRDWTVLYEGTANEVGEQPKSPVAIEPETQPANQTNNPAGNPAAPAPSGAPTLSVEPARVELVGDAGAELVVTLPLDCSLVIDGRKVERDAARYVHPVRSDLESPSPIRLQWSGRGRQGNRTVVVTRRLGELSFEDGCTLTDVAERRGGVWGTDAATVQLSARVAPKAERLRVNGELVEGVDWQGRDAVVTLPVAPGRNQLVVQFERRFHQPVTQTLEVTRVGDPQLELVGETRAEDRVTGDAYAVRVRCDLWTDRVVAVRGGVETPLSRDANTRTFGGRVPLDAGGNEVVLRATNCFGRTAARTLSITRSASMQKPLLRGLVVVAGDGSERPVRKDRQAFFSADSRLRVDSDDANARVMANGVVLPRDGDGLFSIAPALPEQCKSTRISLVVANDAGEAGAFPFIGWLDTEPPKVEVSGPVTAVRGQPFTIEGTWVDDGGLKRRGTTIGEQRARLSPGGGVAKQGTWKLEHPGLAASGQLTLVVLDRAGNRTELQIPVTVQ
ncbi:MAG: protein kinase domain-containing protein [Planctomycetota bacterium]